MASDSGYDIYPIVAINKEGPFTWRCLAEAEHDRLLSVAEHVPSHDQRRMVLETKAHAKKLQAMFWMKRGDEGAYPFYGWDPRLNQLLSMSNG